MAASLGGNGEPYIAKMISFALVVEGSFKAEGKENIPLQKVALGAPVVVFNPPSAVFSQGTVYTLAIPVLRSTSLHLLYLLLVQPGTYCMHTGIEPHLMGILLEFIHV